MVETKLHHWKFHAPWKFQGQKPRPLDIPHDFFGTPPESPVLFYLTPGISTFCLFLQHLWKFHVLNLPCSAQSDHPFLCEFPGEA